jgi:peptidoglycan hydrolase-like protein with peptidoglycan-binding domain
LQKFLASNHDIYSTGLVTGYFGSMTKTAVKNFQYAYDLTIDGIAGANTKNKVNSLILGGKGMDIYSPSISNMSVIPSGKNVTFTFNSNEAVKATVFYDTNRIIWSETEVSYGTPFISGAGVSDATFTTNKQITVNNLSANTIYNYTVLVTDASGNFSVTWPSAFVTGQ